MVIIFYNIIIYYLYSVYQNCVSIVCQPVWKCYMCMPGEAGYNLRIICYQETKSRVTTTNGCLFHAWLRVMILRLRA